MVYAREYYLIVRDIQLIGALGGQSARSGRIARLGHIQIARYNSRPIQLFRQTLLAAARDHLSLAQQRIVQIGAIRALPAHPEVADSLARLQHAGLRLAALTNSTLAVATEQLTRAGLADSFEQILSADMVRRLKPAPEPYLMAAERMGVAIGAIRMIAAHAWDIAGALRAGCAAAFVARPGMVLDPLVPPPDIIGANMREVADQILAVELAPT